MQSSSNTSKQRGSSPAQRAIVAVVVISLLANTIETTACRRDDGRWYETK